MNPYNPNIHQRRSVRVKGHDYSQEGLYFITICVQGRLCLFGEITKGKMILNDVGKIANEYWMEIPKHFSNIELHKYIVMPNHVHGIIEIAGPSHGMAPPDITGNIVGTRHGVSIVGTSHETGIVGTRHGVSLPDATDNAVRPRHGVAQPPPAQPNINQFGKPVSGSVPVVINQYKSSVKRWCNKNGHQYFRWQSRFYDHIIRNEQSYSTISDYITNNPVKWQDDKFYSA